MKRKGLKKAVSLLLCLLMTLPLFACGDEEATTASTDAPETEASTEAQTAEPTETPTTEAPTSEPTEAPTTEAPTDETTEAPTDNPTEAPTTEAPTDEPTEAPTTEAPTDETTEPETEPVIPDDYSDGEAIPEAGAAWADGAFASEKHTYDASAAVEKTAAEMLDLLKDKKAMAEGEVYIVPDEVLELQSDKSYYGNMAALIVPKGIKISGADNIVIKELIIVGSITADSSKDIDLYNVDIISDGTALKADAQCSDIMIDSCIISANDIAISSEGDRISIYQSAISAPKAVISSGSDLTVQDSKIIAESLAVSSSGKYAVIRENTVEAAIGGVGIELTAGSENGLVALNAVKGAQISLKLDGVFNCSAVLNSAIRISGNNSKNLYVVENSLGGAIELRNNNYLLCDDNKFIEDEKIHPVISKDNKNFNGNDLHDTTVRAEHGANEELLPHTNKDLFINMERRQNITDLSYTGNVSYTAYMSAKPKDGSSVIIVPPGVYNSSLVTLSESLSNTNIYAFGVYHEKHVQTDASGALVGTVMGSMHNLIQIDGSSIEIHGLTLGYDYQSSGQAYVLEKWSEGGSNYIRVVSGAGYYNGYGASNTRIFSTGSVGTHGDELHSWNRGINHQYIEQSDDGTIVYKITAKSDVFDKILPGDILGCRLAGDNGGTIYIYGADILLKDCVVYGYSAGLALVAQGPGVKNVRIERHHNTTHSAPIIDEATYNKYKALEKQYGLTPDGDDPVAEGAQGLEVYIDEWGNYRGCLPRYGSVDGTHIMGTEQGVSATSTIFENMVDDSSNQRASSSRIAGIYNNGNMTNIYYKGSLAETYYDIHKGAGSTSAKPGNTQDFRRGDTIFAYASNGKTLVETRVYSDSVLAGALPSGCHIVHSDANKDCICDDPACKAILHADIKNTSGASKRDCKCDVCGAKVHSDTENGRGNGKCNNCNDTLTDSDGNGINDPDNAFIITDVAVNAKYDPATSTLSYSIFAADNYIITYKTNVYMVTVPTNKVNTAALEDYDMTDNDYFMNDKVICDNLSLNSANFTFDNVLMQNYNSRGILMKTTNSTVKNCTFRNVGLTGMLMAVETSWGESTVPKNITVTGCLFDNVACAWGNEASMDWAIPMAIHGLGGAISDGIDDLSEDALPCKNIRILNNKFTNVNQYYAIAVSAAQNVTISGNIFEGRTVLDEETGERVEALQFARAININSCINVTISDNTYLRFGDKEIKDVIVARNYKNLGGSDIENALDENGERYFPVDKGLN